MYNPIGQHDIQNKLQAVGIFNETERYREETVLLIGDMNNLLRFLFLKAYQVSMYMYIVTYIHRQQLMQ